MNKYKHILLLVNLIVVAPAVAMYYFGGLNDLDTANKNLVAAFYVLLIPAMLVVLVDLIYMIKYARNQNKATQFSQTVSTPAMGWRKYITVLALWNIGVFALLLLIVVQIATLSSHNNGDETGAAVTFIFFMPVFIITVVINIYRALKRM